VAILAHTADGVRLMEPSGWVQRPVFPNYILSLSSQDSNKEVGEPIAATQLKSVPPVTVIVTVTVSH
jgi:hypothetical protein